MSALEEIFEKIRLEAAKLIRSIEDYQRHGNTEAIGRVIQQLERAIGGYNELLRSQNGSEFRQNCSRVLNNFLRVYGFQEGSSHVVFLREVCMFLPHERDLLSIEDPSDVEELSIHFVGQQALPRVPFVEATSDSSALSPPGLYGYLHAVVDSIYQASAGLSHYGLQLADSYLDAMVGAMQNYAHDVVQNCPSYFPPQSTSLRNNRSAFFSNVVLVDSLSEDPRLSTLPLLGSAALPSAVLAGPVVRNVSATHLPSATVVSYVRK